jgi:hypothetical protein
MILSFRVSAKIHICDFFSIIFAAGEVGPAGFDFPWEFGPKCLGFASDYPGNCCEFAPVCAGFPVRFQPFSWQLQQDVLGFPWRFCQIWLEILPNEGPK